MDDLYKKMLLSLPDDFFINWQWHIGDKALCLDSLSRGEVIIMDGICHGLVKVAWVDRIFLETEQECIDRLRPVPSQKQLQECYAVNGFTFIHMLHIFSEERISRVGCKIPYDVDCITLAYIVYLKYDKEWNGETWI